MSAKDHSEERPSLHDEAVFGSALPLGFPGPFRTMLQLHPAAPDDEDPWDIDYVDMYEQMWQAVSVDPITQSMVTRHPFLASLILSPNRPKLTPKAAEALKESTPEGAQLKDVLEIWFQRLDRLAEPFLRELVEQEDSAECLSYVLYDALTPERIRWFEENGESTLRGMISNNPSLTRTLIIGVAEEVLIASDPELAGALMTWLVDALYEADGGSEASRGPVYPLLLALAEDALDPRRKNQALGLVQWLVDVLLKDDNASLLWDVVRRTIRALGSEDQPDVLAVMGGALVVAICKMILDDARDLFADPVDANLLSVKEAAAYLGIRPYTLHTHIQTRAGTPSAVPAVMRKRKRGRSAYVIPVDELERWATEHWQPIRRRSRSNA